MQTSFDIEQTVRMIQKQYKQNDRSCRLLTLWCLDLTFYLLWILTEKCYTDKGG